jgi:hypothetical protein
MNKTVCIVTLLILGLAPLSRAEVVFGRFYTTPKQREQLDEARRTQPEQITLALPEQEIQETDGGPAQPAASSIMLDGIVYRSDGKNTAWINRNSTNEGNVETQYTRVEEKDVDSNRVTIQLPGSGDRVPMKVGQEYDVNSKQIHDHMKDPVTSDTPTATDSTRPMR